MKLKNPFLTAGYAGKEYFCDRVKETADLISRLDNDTNMTLVSPRRYGKTGLIKHVLGLLAERGDVSVVYLDILATRNLAEFAKLFANAVFSSVETKLEKVLEAAVQFARAIRPTLGIDEMTGKPKISFDIAPDEAQASVESVLDYLARRRGRVVVAIDEFQQIAEYPESGTEALLRSKIQFMHNVQFVFAGSRQRMMAEMFTSPKRPFYNSTGNLSLKAIDRDEYYGFASRFFSGDGRELPRETFDAVYGRFDGVTWHVQSVLKGLFAGDWKAPDADAVNAVVAGLQEENSDNYAYMLSRCTDGAAELLRAIAAERVVSEPLSADFARTHSLRAPSSVKYALEKLLADELLYQCEDGYVIYDRFFGEWLAR